MVGIVALILLGGWILFVGGCFFFLFRNDWVCDWRTYFISFENGKFYNYLPSYDDMLYRYFWVWGRKNWILWIKKNKGI